MINEQVRKKIKQVINKAEGDLESDTVQSFIKELTSGMGSQFVSQVESMVVAAKIEYDEGVR
jgi:hypothetical protein